MNPDSKSKQQPQSEVFKISPRISLVVNQDPTHQGLVPAADEFKDTSHVLEQVAVSIVNKRPVLLKGDTGSGKTALVRFLAMKTKNAFRRVNLNGGTTAEDLVGRTLLNEKGTYWVDGVLVDAQETRELMHSITQKYRVKWIGVGIDCGKAIVDLCGTGIAVDRPSQVPEAFGAIIQKLLSPKH